jgi:hypothetical protein
MFVSAERLPATAADEVLVPGAEALFIRVIGQAIEDMSEPAQKAEAEDFFGGPAFRRYCVLLGWDDRWARRRILKFVENEDVSS